MRQFVCILAFGISGLIQTASSGLGGHPVTIDQPMSPPNWALLERELLRANTTACREFFDRYFDERGFLLCVERWGADDGPDDAIENMIYWPILHAVGASDSILEMYKKAWEGHLRQYTAAKTVEVPFARDGMYYKEFPVMFDWLHHAEGLTVFCLQGLSDPYDHRFQKRARRFSGFYMGDDPQAQNYDPKYKIIRSMFNGSRGPMLRKATALDWAGDPIEVENRFVLGHGEQSYEEVLAHFRDYNDVAGDHPANLLSTALALNAYMIDHEPIYKAWVLEYVEAWRDRMIENGNVIPSNIGLDGKIGGAADGKWYGGVYGWGFTVEGVGESSGPSHRQTFDRGFQGFLNAVLLTGDRSLLDPWRKQMDTVNSNKRVVNGTTLYPHKYGDDGWYNFQPQPYSAGATGIYYVSMQDEDFRRVATNPWFDYLHGTNPQYPEHALRSDFEHIRGRVAGMRSDTTTPDTRLSDDPLKYTPAAVRSLTELMLGGMYPARTGMVLHCRLRYFDPIRRRAGVPEHVAALVEKMTSDEVVVTLVNTSPIDSCKIVVQAGGYAEHQFMSVEIGGREQSIDASHFSVELAPGAGDRMKLKMQRYVNQPTLRFPWDQ
ncbi:MAG: hypothetical protein MK102_14985 [Fuerstiella sp.]|nr:hypothetical protein [Fuerstiella sp.]